ncbi:unnamed protein product [Rotaria sp. Silwood1]|nr:unnamed protein product [Rotaria sp. Silwood1]
MISTVNNSSCADNFTEGQIPNQQSQRNNNRLQLQSFIDQYGIVKTRTPTINRIKKHLNKFCKTLSCISIINALLNRIPIIRCLKEYNIRTSLFGDIIAGITVAIMHIPQGTFAITSLMTGQAIDGASLEYSNVINNESYVLSNISEAMIISEKVGLATTLAFFVGMVQLTLSIFRLGFLTVYLTEPFISGFTAGAAVHVFSSQIPSVFGVKSPRNVDGAFKLPRFYIRLIASIIKHVNWVSTAIAFTSIFLLYIAKHLNDRYKSILRIVIPSELILVGLSFVDRCIVIGTIISHFTEIHNRHGVSVVGPIKQGLPPPISPPFKQISYLVVHAVPIAMVTLCISISMAKMFSRKHNYKVSSNQARQFVNIKILRFDESLYACNAPFFKRKFYELIGIKLRQEPLIPYEMLNLNQNEGIRYKYVVLDCSPFNFIDTVGVKLLIEIYNDLKKRDIKLYLSECRCK